MKTQPIDQYAKNLDPQVRDAVLGNSRAGYEKRVDVLFGDFPHANELRHLAGAVKQHTLENLDQYLEQAESRLIANGAKVHWAETDEDACAQILAILREHGAKRLVKSKSMATEEIHLVPYLEKNGIESLETDLGEFIVQIDGDHPSHIVKPILHKSRRDIAQSFEKHGLGEYNDDPATITRRARAFLRQKYLDSDAAITGANFISAESGRLVLVTNEGNSRFCLAAAPLHIAIVGIEKLVPTDRDLGLMLNMLGRSATGQQLTVYTEFIRGPRGPEQPDGPEAMHVIFLDNGRSEILAGECKEILRCIRCGACMNVCPVYRQASGHAYRSVYPGPLGAVLSPLLAGKKFPQFADLPKASSLCGACQEVCPVDIPLPDLLLRLRDRAHTEHIPSPGTPPMAPWAIMARNPGLWKAALTGGHAINHMPARLIPIPALQAWTASRKLPPWEGNAFRRWMRHRDHTSSEKSHD